MLTRTTIATLSLACALAGCSSTPPEQEAARAACAAQQTDTDACQAAFLQGYSDARAALEAGSDLTTQQVNTGAGRQDSLTTSVAYTSGVTYARSMHS